MSANSKQALIASHAEKACSFLRGRRQRSAFLRSVLSRPRKTSLAWHISCTEANPEPLPFSQLAPRVGPMSSTPNSLTYFGQSCTSHGSHSYLRLLPFAATAEKHVLCRPIASLSPCTRQVKAFCASFMWRHFAASAHA